MITALSYIGFTSPNADDWRTFGPEVLGAQLAPDQADGAVRLRIDEAPARIIIHPGAVNDLAYMGWEVDDLDATITSLEQAGVSVARGAVARFTDPFGFHHELISGPMSGEPFVPGRAMSGFVTGDQGLGHAVIIVPDLVAVEAFYCNVLGFKVSDTIQAGTTLRFLHCAGHQARHHSLALVSAPGMVGIHHLMLEVTNLDDVGRALDIVNERKIPLAMSMGRHTNDLMTSFYVRTPSGFEIEYGTGGILVNDDNWELGHYNATSHWGHRPPPSGPLPPGIIRPYVAA
jgi:extradiol dioxygenase